VAVNSPFAPCCSLPSSLVADSHSNIVAFPVASRYLPVAAVFKGGTGKTMSDEKATATLTETEEVTAPSDYQAEHIQVLKGLEGVRKRPAMYIGDTSTKGLHHLLEEVVDNAVDEALAGYCRRIEVTLHQDGSVSVTDDGRGIPVDIHPEEKRPAVEVVLTMLHAGGKFQTGAYKVSGGLHGVGVSVVNALSEWLEVKVKRDGKIWWQRYERGEPVTPLKVIGKATKTGTTITFKPDPEIFETTQWDAERIKQRLHELAFLNPQVRFIFRDERTGEEAEFHEKGGLAAYVQHLNRNRESCIAPSRSAAPAKWSRMENCWMKSAWKSPCNITKATKSKSSVSPTMFGRWMVARTKAASKTPSPAPSTPTPEKSAC